MPLFLACRIVVLLFLDQQTFQTDKVGAALICSRSLLQYDLSQLSSTSKPGSCEGPLSMMQSVLHT